MRVRNVTGRGWLALAAWALAVLPACGDASPVDSTGTTATTTVASTAAPGPSRPVMPVFADDDEPIALDPAVTTGRLDNGLSYYIRENTAPGGRAQLRLVVKAGSAFEGDGQAGVAHYLEHMMFNGTADFPANELVSVLQRFGAEFGPDINAYTSYEETVYMLELPTDDPATIATGFDVLLQWATAATLDPAEVDRERGVLVEEWRLRDQGFWGRYVTAVTDRLLAGTPYANRLPLAAPTELEATTPASLRAFYRDWYRPDRIGVVAVGDFDSETIEGLIRDRFEDVASPVDPPDAPDLYTRAFSAPQFLVMADPEAEYSFVELNYPVPSGAGSGTVGALRQSIALDAAFDIVATRLHEDSLRGTTPYFDPSRASNEFVRTQGTDGFAAYANPDDLGDTAAALMTEVERAVRFGFFAGELDRVVGDMRAEVESEFAQGDTKQDSAFAADYVEHYLGNTPAAEARAWRDLRLRLVDELTLDQVWATFVTIIESTEPLVIAAAPEAAAADMPDEATLAALLDAAATADLAPRSDDTTVAAALMDPPAPANVTLRSTLPDTVIPVLEFANGLRFISWPTDIHQGHAELLAGSPGGWVALSPDDVVAARLVDDVMLASGVGDFDQVTLERMLVGTDVELQPFVDEVWEGFRGGADTTDLETLFQLVHLTMLDPRFDPIAVPIVQNRLEQPVRSPETLADTALELAIAAAAYPGDPRFSPLPTAEELDALDLSRVEAVFDDRFGDAGDFVFVLVGDFAPEAAADLAARYLGTLPGAGAPEGFADDRPEEPAGVVTGLVEAGTGERGALTLLFRTRAALSPDRRVHLDILQAVVEQRLVRHIREELAASYSPSVAITQIDEPVPGVEVSIRIDGDPAGIDDVSSALIDDLAALVADGPTEEEFAIGREQVYRNYELIDNLQLARVMLQAAYHPESLVTEIISRFDRVVAATGDDIRTVAREVITLDEYVEVRLVPIGFAE